MTSMQLEWGFEQSLLLSGVSGDGARAHARAGLESRVQVLQLRDRVNFPDRVLPPASAQPIHHTKQPWLPPQHSVNLHSSSRFSVGPLCVTRIDVRWWFVVDPENGLKELGLSRYPMEPSLATRRHRHAVDLRTFDEGVAKIGAALRQHSVASMLREELIGARLYTGPMFYKRAAFPPSPQQVLPPLSPILTSLVRVIRSSHGLH